MPPEHSPLDDPQTQAKVLALLGALHADSKTIKASVERIEVAHDKRLTTIETRISSLEKLAAKVSGIAVAVSTILSLAFQYFFHK
jgi:hypothetical protein